jgi:methyl-accepting chemotaxis protein
MLIALGVGGGIGFALSRNLGRKFEVLRQATDRIQAGDLTVQLKISDREFFADETDELAVSVKGMLSQLNTFVHRVQDNADLVTTAAHDLTREIENVREVNEGISNTVSTGTECSQARASRSRDQLNWTDLKRHRSERGSCAGSIWFCRGSEPEGKQRR